MRKINFFLYSALLVTFSISILLLAKQASALNNGLALTPSMGWNPWNKFGCNISEQIVKEITDAIVSNDMQAAGYEYINLDDCWQVSRDSNGNIMADPQTFPSGIKALVDYVHSKGLKFGIYTSAGSHNCHGRPGSLDYEYKDAATYAAWGVDYVKVDWCFTDDVGLNPQTQYTLWRDAIAASGRPMVFSITSWGRGLPWLWGETTGNLWRTTEDIADNWTSMLKIADRNWHHASFAEPGGWNDPDMLEVGNGGMTLIEYRTHFSLWVIMAAPLIAGNDPRTMSAEIKEILTNPEVIAVAKDPAGIPGMVVWDNYAGLQVWSRKLQTAGERAVVLLNRTLNSATITANWQDLGLAPGTNATVRDLWTKADLGVYTDKFSVSVAPHGVVMVKIVGTEGTPPPKPAVTTGYLSDQSWFYATNFWGTVERNMSNGEQAPKDGRTITLQGKKYAKGIGVHAYSDVRFYLAGNCKTFSAKVGVDDEVKNKGSVIFQVYADGIKLYDSGVMYGNTATKTVNVDISEKQEFRLYVTSDANVDYDHADWADAKATCN